MVSPVAVHPSLPPPVVTTVDSINDKPRFSLCGCTGGHGVIWRFGV